MTAPTLNQFIASIKKGGLARQNRFTVTIGRKATDQSDDRLIQLFCEQTSLPGLSFSSSPVRSYGESREVIYDRNFEAITMTFLVDKDMKVKQYFDDWMKEIIDPGTRLNQYYEKYIKDIVILTQDTKDIDTYKVVLYEAYPKTVGAVTLDYNSKDVMKLQVTFNYKYHTNDIQLNVRGEVVKNPLGFNLPDPYQLSRKLGDYIRGSTTSSLSTSDLYFSNFNQYQENLNDSLSVSRALERQGITTGTGSVF